MSPRPLPASDLKGKAMLRRSEKDEERAGDELMELYGFRSIHFSQARASMQTEGIPDRKYFHRGRRMAVWWEAKAIGGKQRKAQREFQLDCEACGEAYVLGPLEELRAWLIPNIARLTPEEEHRLLYGTGTIESRGFFSDSIPESDECGCDRESSESPYP